MAPQFRFTPHAEAPEAGSTRSTSMASFESTSMASFSSFMGEGSALSSSSSSAHEERFSKDSDVVASAAALTFDAASAARLAVSETTTFRVAEVEVDVARGGRPASGFAFGFAFGFATRIDTSPSRDPSAATASAASAAAARSVDGSVKLRRNESDRVDAARSDEPTTTSLALPSPLPPPLPPALLPPLCFFPPAPAPSPP